MSINFPLEEKTDPRIKRTRSLLSQAFLDVLAEKTFQSISVQDVTEKAGVNRSTFYLHFLDKYALLGYSITQLFREELDKRMLHSCHFSPENLRSLIITVAEFILHSNKHCTTTDPQFESLVEAQVKKQMQELTQLWAEKEGLSTPDSRTASIAASWAIYGLALEWSHDKNRPPAEVLAATISPLITSILGLALPVEAV
jgi:AcrR family transcriptional regulator